MNVHFDALFDEPDRSAVRDPDFAQVTIGDYVVEQRIANNPFSQVYIARDTVLQRRAAVKVLRNANVGDSEVTSRFRAEGEILARLRHPNVIQIYGFATIEGLPCLFMEYASDGTLASYLDQPVAPLDAALLLLRVARGVASAHQLGIVHRDIKPQNILIDRSIREPSLETIFGFIKVSDFGIAKILSDFESVTLTVHQPGTVPWMAPEQIDRQLGDIGPPTDVFAMGVLLYRMVTGANPFQSTSLPQTLTKIVDHPVARLSEQRADIPGWLDDLCARCLRKNPHDRFADAEELASAIENEMPHLQHAFGMQRASRRLAKPTSDSAGSRSGIPLLLFAVGLLAAAVIFVALRGLWGG